MVHEFFRRSWLSIAGFKAAGLSSDSQPLPLCLSFFEVLQTWTQTADRWRKDVEELQRSVKKELFDVQQAKGPAVC